MRYLPPIAKPRKPRVLDFDIECRPLGWYGGDFVHKEITAIGAQFIGEKGPPYCFLLGEWTLEYILAEFVWFYNQADIVTGHYIRGFDLPTINGALLELGMPPLKSKMSQDTRLDLVRFQGLSKSQENLGALLGLRKPKVQMDQGKWREANRLTNKGLELTRKRVIGDVRQHIELRAELMKRNMLGPPKLWKSSSSGVNHGYTA